MALRTVFLCSGQGSQYFGMGAALYEQGGVFRKQLQKMDERVFALTEHSILHTLYGSHARLARFDDIAQTGAAIFMVEYALAQALIEAGIAPQVTLGASHGAFAASVIAGFLDMEQGLALSLQHGAIMRDSGIRGGMTAVLAEPALFESPELKDNAVIAALNFARHFVIAAEPANLQAAEDFLKSRSVSFQRLPVNYPFHSPWLEPVRTAILEADAGLRSSAPVIPMLCCASADYADHLANDFFWRAARAPIQFAKAIERLEQDGPCRYVDIGPAGSLATFLKYLLPADTRSQVFAVMTPYGRDLANLATLLASR